MFNSPADFPSLFPRTRLLLAHCDTQALCCFVRMSLRKARPRQNRLWTLQMLIWRWCAVSASSSRRKGLTRTSKMPLTAFKWSKKKMWRFSPPQSHNRFSKRFGQKLNQRPQAPRTDPHGKRLHGSGSHLLIEAETQVFIRIDRGVKDTDFVVQMRAGAASALSHVTN